jgi:threonine/homoserine/homoserine lactone efflux protein
MTLLTFLFTVVCISISGVMSPGPVTTVTITMGARNRHAGMLIGLGHGLLEIPLMVLIVLGADKLLAARPFQIVIGLAGGVVLILMASQIWRDSCKPMETEAPATTGRGPVATGFILSAGNPFFLIWWGTVGLGLATRAKGLGILAFVLFTITHIMCDVIWLEVLSQASFRGARVLSSRTFSYVLRACAFALAWFAGVFFWNAARTLLHPAGS